MDDPQAFWKTLSNAEREIAILSTEKRHLTKRVEELIKSVSMMELKVAHHAKHIDILEKIEEEKTRIKRTWWGTFKTQWYRVIMISTVITGFLVTNFEIVRQFPRP